MALSLLSLNALLHLLTNILEQKWYKEFEFRGMRDEGWAWSCKNNRKVEMINILNSNEVRKILDRNIETRILFL
jgi:hypothetical protein